MNNKTDRGKENLVKKLKLQCKNVQSNKNLKSARGITLVALVITIIFSYDEILKFSNNKGFLLQAIY